MRRVAITGIGSITPAGIGVEPLWDQALSGESRVKRLDRFDASAYSCQIAGQADAFIAEDWLSPRLVKKTDRFTHLAMAAADIALRGAAIEIGPDGVDPTRIGVMIGNVLGGWEFAERELRDLWAEGPREVSPYQATAWFPTAPQGNICIKHGIKGRSRTFVTDRASGASALIHAAETIRRGHADVMIAGGTEQPLSPYAWLCCQTGDFLTRFGNSDPAVAYRPFDRRHTGTAIGEGAVLFVLEDADHARARGVPVLAEIAGWAQNTDGYMPYYTAEPYGDTLSAAMRRSLAAADIGPEDLGCVFADGSGIPREDASEVAGMRRVFGSGGVPVTATKASVGHLMGAAAAADTALAVRALRESSIPPVTNLRTPAPGFDMDFVVEKPRAAHLDHVMITSRGLGGVNACLTLRR